MSNRSGSSERRPNRLAGQTSPYLLQHLYNPVDWQPWSPEALAAARRDDKPIFLSIGYAACHWCHVMERESFEDADVAAFLNERFVPIKVDREERPDLDEIYMHAVQMMVGQGGWPLNLFLTPSLEPFFGGTYFPPEDRWGRASFRTVLERVDEAWRARRDEVEASASRLAAAVASLGALEAPPPTSRLAGLADSARAAAELASRFDAMWGGFGSAPKFPPHGGLQLLLREHARSGDPVPLRMVEATLERMAGGGMYDQIGGGFARYSVDERWLVPHFEKMLYDQALLVPVYVEAWKITRRPLYRRVVEETLDFVRRELTHTDGGFFSSLDADSEGEEGKFYVWTPDSVTAELGREDGAFFCEIYGIAPGGNFEGHSIPNLLHGSLADQAKQRGTTDDGLVARLAPLRARLLAARERRIRPGTDDKVLTAWNGLMITAFARAYQVFGRTEDLDAARRAADFVRARLTADGRLLVSWREGRGQLKAYLDDHAFYARGLLDLYESTFDRADLDEAARVARLAIEHFSASEGGFHLTATDHEALLARPVSTHDGALPAGSGVMCETLARLALHLDDDSLRTPVVATLRTLRPYVERAPSAFAALLTAAELIEGVPVEIVIADASMREMLATAWRTFLPARVIAAAPVGSDPDLPLLRGRVATATGPTAWVCRRSVCSAPIHDSASLARALDLH